MTEDKEIREEDLKNTLEEKLGPVISGAMQKYLGVTIRELKEDLTSRLKRPWIEYDVDTSVPFKRAKHLFKRQYFRKLLLLSFGNVSEVARIAGVNRRSIHRLIHEVGIDVEKIRRDMVKRYDIKQDTVNSIIGDVLEKYKEVIHPDKLEGMYANVSEISKDLIEGLPEDPPTLAEAEMQFEKEYFKKALEENGWNVSSAAKKIGLRYETLHRKIKSLGIEEKK